MHPFSTGPPPPPKKKEKQPQGVEKECIENEWVTGMLS